MNSYNRLLLHRLADIFGYSPFFHHLIVDLLNVFCHIFPFFFFLWNNVAAHMYLTSVDNNILLFSSFSHESVGEGDDRHLILERCPETSMYVKTNKP